MTETAIAAGLPRPEIEEQGDSVIVRFQHGQMGLPASVQSATDRAT